MDGSMDKYRWINEMIRSIDGVKKDNCLLCNTFDITSMTILASKYEKWWDMMMMIIGSIWWWW